MPRRIGDRLPRALLFDWVLEEWVEVAAWTPQTTDAAHGFAGLPLGNAQRQDGRLRLRLDYQGHPGANLGVGVDHVALVPR